MKKVLILIFGCTIFLLGCSNQSITTQNSPSEKPAKTPIPKTTEPISPEKTTSHIEKGSNNSTNIDVKVSPENQPQAEIKNNIISSDKIRQLRTAGVPVIMPTYIPGGFRLIDFQYKTHENSVKTKYGYYTAIYKGINNSCFKIEGTNEPLGGGAIMIRQWDINTENFGQVALQEVISAGEPNTPMLTANLFLPDIGHGVNYLFDSPFYSARSRTNSGFNCNSISVQEAIKIIQSWQFKNP